MTPRTIIFIVLVCIALLILVAFFLRVTKKLYFKHVQPLLSAGILSHLAYMFAHGFFVCLVFCMALAASIYFFPHTEKEIANKYIKIGVSSEVGKLRSFNMMLSQPWEIEGKNIDSLNRDFSLMFNVETPIPDSVKFEVDVRSNFDTSFKLDKSLASNIDIDTIGEEITKFNVKFTNKDSSSHPCFSIKSNASIFDDKDHPYVNFYLSFDKPFSCLSRDSVGNLIGNDSQLYVYLNTKVDSLGFGDMKYDVVSVKPEPETNNPYEFGYYTPAKVKEVLEKGIYISTVNRDLKAEMDKKTTLYSVMCGAAVSFLFTVIIVLLTKWRNLNQRAGRKDPYD